MMPSGLQLFHVVNQNLTEARGHHVLGRLVGTITDSRHEVHSTELTADSVVNTLGSTPVLFELVIPVALMSAKLLSPLLHDLRSGDRSESHLYSLVEVHQAILAWSL